MKKVLATALSLLMALGMLTACGGGNSSSAGGSISGGEPGGDATATGQTYRELYSSEFTTFDYLVTGNNNEMKVLADCIDGLVEWDKYGVVQPALAESWSHNDDYTVWTFNIRPGVYWYDSEGEEYAEVTADDWVAAAEYVSDAYNDSATQYMYNGFVKNAEVFYDQTADMLDAENAVTDGEAESVEAYYEENDIDPDSFITFDEVGVKALDTYTLEYTLENSCTFFLSLTSFSSYLPVNRDFLMAQGGGAATGGSFGLDYFNILYCGAYIMTEYEPNVRRILEVNENYWDRDNVFITRLEWIYNQNDTTIAPSMFQAGEIDFAVIPSDIIDEWMSNPETEALISPSTLDLDYSYFYTFNFEPRFDAEYEPDNWTIAVNNENFRKSIQAGLDRVKAVSVYDPYNPQDMLINTITPEGFVFDGGTDYTEYGGLDAFIKNDSFNEEAALAYRDAAIEELTAAGASFPITVLLPYNPSITNWDLECQVVAQQLEALLGNDYINIVVEAGSSTAFLSEVRRSGNYALLLCNWGADFEDPSTYAEPFSYGTSTYNFMYTDESRVLSDIPATNKTTETQAIVNGYYDLIDKAEAIDGADTTARYKAYAEAEAYLIEHAFVIPMRSSTDGYVAEMRNQFDRPYATFGLARFRMKGRQLLDEPMNSEQYLIAKEAWEEERAAALAAAK